MLCRQYVAHSHNRKLVLQATNVQIVTPSPARFSGTVEAVHADGRYGFLRPDSVHPELVTATKGVFDDDSDGEGADATGCAVHACLVVTVCVCSCACCSCV